MSTHIQRQSSDKGVWGAVHNDFHKVLNGGYEFIDIQLNGNNPPSIKQGTRFQVYKDSIFTSPAIATGNANYPASTSITYNLSHAIFEDSADVTFTWNSTPRTESIPAQSDGTWYIYVRGSYDSSYSTKGQGIYGFSKTETPTYSAYRGGWYSASNLRILGQFTSTSGTVSNLYIYRFGNFVERGLFNGKGVYCDATNIYLYPYEVEVNGKVYFSTATTTVRAWSGLSASTWYGVVMNETDGSLSVVALGSGWTGYTCSVATNQLNMMSIYDQGYNYCRAIRSGVWYRILAIFQSNGTPNGFTYCFDIRQRPKGGCKASTNTAGTMINNTYTIVNFEDIDYDINSDVTVGASWSFIPKATAYYNLSASTSLASNTGWAVTEGAYLGIHVNGTIIQTISAYRLSATANPFIMENCGSGTVSVSAGYSLDLRLYQFSGGNINLNGSSSGNIIVINEV